MKEKIEEILKNEEGVSLSKVSKDLNLSFIEVLRHAPTCLLYTSMWFQWELIENLVLCWQE